MIDNDYIHFTDAEIEQHDYNINGQTITIDKVEYWIKSATKDGFNVVKK